MSSRTVLKVSFESRVPVVHRRNTETLVASIVSVTRSKNHSVAWSLSLRVAPSRTIARLALNVRRAVKRTFLGRAGRSGSVDGSVESSGDEAIVLRPRTHSGGSVNRLARLRDDRMLCKRNTSN